MFVCLNVRQTLQDKFDLNYSKQLSHVMKLRVHHLVYKKSLEEADSQVVEMLSTEGYNQILEQILDIVKSSISMVFNKSFSKSQAFCRRPGHGHPTSALLAKDHYLFFPNFRIHITTASNLENQLTRIQRIEIITLQLETSSDATT